MCKSSAATMEATMMLYKIFGTETAIEPKEEVERTIFCHVRKDTCARRYAVIVGCGGPVKVRFSCIPCVLQRSHIVTGTSRAKALL
jgi:hypothetical protein